MQQTYAFWGLMRTEGGGMIRVTVQARNAYEAQQMLKALYGDKLITEGANWTTQL